FGASHPSFQAGVSAPAAAGAVDGRVGAVDGEADARAVDARTGAGGVDGWIAAGAVDGEAGARSVNSPGGADVVDDWTGHAAVNGRTGEGHRDPSPGRPAAVDRRSDSRLLRTHDAPLTQVADRASPPVTPRFLPG